MITELIQIWGPSKGRPKTPLSKALLMAIWYLSTRESFNVIASRFNIEKGNAFRLCWRLFKIIYWKRKKFIKWPDSLEEKEYEFKSIAQFPNVIGCIDCMKISAQHKTHVKVLAVCDANLLFTDVHIKWPGNVYSIESLFNESPLNELMTNNETIQTKNFHLLGGSSFPLYGHLMIPYRNDGLLTSAQLIYNQKHETTHSCIKIAIAKLVTRFERVKSFREIKDVEQVKYYLMAAFILHNYILINETDDQCIDEELLKSEDDECSTMDYQNLDGDLKRNELSEIFVQYDYDENII